MSDKSEGGQLRKSDWPLLLLSFAVLLVYLYYTIMFLLFTPYPGIDFTTVSEGWLVNDSRQAELAVGDLIVQIEGVTFLDYLEDRTQVPFSGFGPGDEVDLVVEPGNRMVEMKMPPPTWGERIRRLLFAAWFFPFWGAGTAVLLLLRPRDIRWLLLVLFMYLTAVWVVTGTLGSWRVGGSRILLGVFNWLMIPVIVHLHVVVPTPVFPRWSRYVMPPLYISAGVVAILELFEIPPRELAQWALVASILFSFLLLLYRYFARADIALERLATRLMLAGIGLAFGPGLILQLLPQLLGAGNVGVLGLSIAIIAIPALPVFYIYALYKRQLGALEFRANRLLGLYSFILLYPPLFLIFILVGEQWIELGGLRTVYLLVVSIAFVVGTPPLLNRFQHWIDRMAYGSVHNPDEILRMFARRIPSTLQRQDLIQLVEEDIISSLLIRQSVLILCNEDKEIVLYQQGVTAEEVPQTAVQLRALLAEPGVYHPPSTNRRDPLGWVLLTIPLKTREETIGVWLFGRRDPDDFYPRSDIDLLQTLANQIAPIIENIRLYEALQSHADNLAADVAARTAELQAERDRTQAILDNAGEGVFFMDHRGLLLYMNPTMAEQTGYSDDDMLGQSIRLWQTDDTQEASEALWQAIESGEAWSGELILKRQDGARYDVALTISPIEMASGQFTGFVGVQSDISKLKEVDRIKSNLISNVSHELKTPLTNIRMYLTLLERGRTERWPDYLAIIDHESARLTQLIQDLLDLSKLETGDVPMRIEPVAVHDLIDKVLPTLTTRSKKKEIEVQVDLPPDLPLMLADVGQMEQVIINLLVNALNYTPKGGKIVVSAGIGKLGAKSMVYIRVSDTGPGITQEDMMYLFDRFYRGQASRESKAPGTGLGLAICKEIVERHLGQIEVDSEPGEGATFTVWIMAADTSREKPVYV